MKRIPSLVLISFLFLNAGNESSKIAQNKNTDTSTTTVAKSDTQINFVYDPAIDPLIAGAAFTKKACRHFRQKMFELTLKPGSFVANAFSS